METAEQIFGISAAAKFLDLSECYTRLLADRGEIRCLRTERNRRLFRREDLEKFLSDRRRAECPEAPGR